MNKEREMSSSSPSSPRPTVPPPSSSNCTYCGEPIKWHFHEEYAEWRSIDPETGEEHECDPSSMLKTTVDMANCKRCGKLVRWGPPPELEDPAVKEATLQDLEGMIIASEQGKYYKDKW